jgi:hypothetical protein
VLDNRGRRFPSFEGRFSAGTMRRRCRSGEYVCEKASSMRIVLTLVASCITVAACTGSRNVSSPPPTVSYKVTGNNVSRANVKAQNYCAHYGRSALLKEIQPVPSGKVAVYSCEGATTADHGSAPLAGSSIEPAHRSVTH